MTHLALTGNPNCGKTTLFNRLTGTCQPVGNFPGITVSPKTAPLSRRRDCLLTDLPGVYSLRPLSPEERAARAFLLQGPTCIIDLIAAPDLPRGLYLTMQLLELGLPMVVGLNMMDELARSGGRVDVMALSRLLRVPVVPLNAAKGQGVEALLDTAAHTAAVDLRPSPPELEDAAAAAYLRRLEGLLAPAAARAGVAPAFAAGRWAEGDTAVPLRPDAAAARKIAALSEDFARRTGQTPESALAAGRWRQIDALCGRCFHPPAPRGGAAGRLADRLTMTAPLAPAVFLGVVLGLFTLTFRTLGPALCRPLGQILAALAKLADAALCAADAAPYLRGLIREGLFAGVGSVVEFLPVMGVLFFLLSLLEQSGYLARGALAMDRPLAALGLSGRSAVPLLMGFGCTVPAVLSARTLPTRRERRLTVLLVPFMSCSAKIPVYTVLAAAAVPGYGGWGLLILYLTGIAAGILYGRTVQALRPGGGIPFVLELPPWRCPSVKTALNTAADRAGEFLRRAFGVIFLTSLAVWILGHTGPDLRPAQGSGSLLALLGNAAAPLLAPIGLGDWRIAAALLTGLAAKESILATLGVLTAGEAASVLSPASACSLLAFTLFYSPCAAALSAMGRELGSRLAALLAGLFHTLLAYGAAWAVYRLAGLFLS